MELDRRFRHCDVSLIAGAILCVVIFDVSIDVSIDVDDVIKALLSRGLSQRPQFARLVLQSSKTLPVTFHADRRPDVPVGQKYERHQDGQRELKEAANFKAAKTAKIFNCRLKAPSYQVIFHYLHRLS